MRIVNVLIVALILCACATTVRQSQPTAKGTTEQCRKQAEKKRNGGQIPPQEHYICPIEKDDYQPWDSSSSQPAKGETKQKSTIIIHPELEIDKPKEHYESVCLLTANPACPPVDLQKYILDIFVKDEIVTAADLMRAYNKRPISGLWGSWLLEPFEDERLSRDTLILRTQYRPDRRCDFSLKWQVVLFKLTHYEGRGLVYVTVGYRFSSVHTPSHSKGCRIRPPPGHVNADSGDEEIPYCED